MGCNFTEVISLTANVCTILAFGVAAHLWWTWKKQHNYSFTRDKIFEAEIAISKLHTAHMSYVHEYFEYKLADLKTNEVFDPPYYQQKFRDAQNSIDKYANEYDVALHSLSVLDVGYPKDKIKNFMKLDSFYTSYMNKLNEFEDTETLTAYFWDKALPEMQDSRKQAIASLTKIRKEL